MAGSDFTSFKSILFACPVTSRPQGTTGTESSKAAVVVQGDGTVAWTKAMGVEVVRRGQFII